MPSMFDALADDDESEDSSDADAGEEKNSEDGTSNIPVYEDLSMTRVDEETVLNAVYGDDFYMKDGPWGSKVFCVNVRPPDIDADRIGSRLE